MKGFGITDRGAVRRENQDSFRMEILEGGDSAVMVLCDGMGGAQAGSVASRMAEEAFMTHALSCFMQPGGPGDLEQVITDANNYANIKVYDRSFADFGCMGMGTTLVGVLVHGSETVVSNVGDSRAYLLTGGEAVRITRDHSLVEDLVLQGKLSREAARKHPRRNVITRALGVEQTVKCDVFRPAMKPGDLLLLCSDGLSNLVRESELVSALAENPDLESFCRFLLKLTLDRGAPDNVTVAVLAR
jgi:serine/threonine protein phosphatase PrpC